MSSQRIVKKTEKSVKLSQQELAQLIGIKDNYNSFSRFSTEIGIDRSSLTRILHFGSGSEPNVKKIRRRLTKLQQSA